MVYVNSKYMVADTLEELHEFGAKIKLTKLWFNHKKNHPFYYLMPTKLVRAIDDGAIPVSGRELIKLMNKLHNSIIKNNNEI